MERSSFFQENRSAIESFGEYFLEKLSDKELIDSLAEKDLEKLARIFKLVFEKLEESEEKTENTALAQLIKAFQSIGEPEEDFEYE